MPNFTTTIFDQIATAAADDASRKDHNSAQIAEIEDTKLAAYAAAVLDLQGVSLQKGNLPKAYADEFDQELLRVGLFTEDEKGRIKKGGAGKRFRDNVPGLVRVMRLKKITIPTQATTGYVRDLFETLGLTSEAKITAFTKSGRDKFLSDHWEAACQNVAKVTFGKDARGAPTPTGMSMAKAFEERAEAIGHDEAFEEMVNEMRLRFNAARAVTEAAQDETEGAKRVSELMENMFA